MLNRSLTGVLFLVLFAGPVMAQNAPQVPASPVQGAIASISEDKTSFTITVKKVTYSIKISADTRYIVNDEPADFVKAIVVGNDVDVFLNKDGTAFVVMANIAPVKGTVKSMKDNTFVVTVKKGDTTVTFNAATKFTLDKKASTAALALAAGNTVTVTTGGDGLATEVVAKGAVKVEAPTTPAVPVKPDAATRPAVPATKGN